MVPAGLRVAGKVSHRRLRSLDEVTCDLIASARLDTDGVAATSDPEDLVGRSVLRKSLGAETVNVQLKGRGIGGKFITGRAK